MKSSKIQEYKYSLKTQAYTSPDSVGLCGDVTLFYLLPPQDAIEIKYLRTHLKLRFDSGIASGDRKIQRIGILSKFDSDPSIADHFRYLDVNITADVNREVELDMNLTSLLKPTNTRYNSDIFLQGVDDNYTYVYLRLGNGDNLINEPTVGDILLWKVDGMYTTTGVK